MIYVEKCFRNIGGYNLMFHFNEKMDMAKARELNPIVLAFIGDAVYSLFVRERLAFNSDKKAGELNKLAVAEVKATAQAAFYTRIKGLLTAEEDNVFHRARNAKKTTRAKSATVAEYNVSTGLEAVLGYLYVIGDIDRLNFLLNEGKE